MSPKIALAVAAAVLSMTALIPGGLAAASKTNRATVAVAHSKLGRILVDGRGRSLYLFERDRNGKSSCNGACLAYWPPLISSGKALAKPGVKASLLGRTKRKDGRWQVTYKRHPLYTFVGDTKKGQTNGEGLTDFGGSWDLVSPAGAKIEKAAGSTSGGYGGYGP
jgi:predicted lipoprotein with Yx(FWY)xxD motif